MHEFLGGPTLTPVNWRMVTRSLARPYRVPVSMVLLVALVPAYILIPTFFPPTIRHVPELALDRAWPLIPFWAIVYGPLYLLLILLPIFVGSAGRTHPAHGLCLPADLDHCLRVFLCGLSDCGTSARSGDWRRIRGVGPAGAVFGRPPYNCLPSLHVAHSFVSALAVSQVHRRLGLIALISGTLVALSTLFTKQHYAVDVIAGVLLAFVAYGTFLARYPAHRIPEFDRRVAPALALCVGALVAGGLAASWLVYLWGGETHFTFGP